MDASVPVLAASEDTGELVIAVVSDTHSNMHSVYALLEWMRERRREVHVVMHAGDIANLEMGHTNVAKLAAAEGEASALLSALEAVHERVIFVPGNHDSPGLFDHDTPTRLTVHSNAAHRQSVRLRDDLFVLGLGGSVPGFREGAHEWNGFPYTNDAALRADLEHVWARRPADAQYVLLTHVGPSGASTTVAKEDLSAPPITSGSDALAELLHDGAAQDAVCCSIHGHTHVARGVDKIGRVPVINAGSLAEGYFALITLCRLPPHNRWATRNIELCALPPGATDAPLPG